jgi:hypothetical protein
MRRSGADKVRSDVRCSLQNFTRRTAARSPFARIPGLALGSAIDRNGEAVMSGDGIERSKSGNPIYRHQARERDWTAPQNYGKHLEEIEAHVEKHIGKIETVFHEIVSDLVHLDVLFVPATEERPYHVLVTSGVGDEPMTVPEGAEGYRHAELMMALPADWPLTEEAFKDEANYWPVRWLKMVGRLPHEYNTWIAWGHTIPNGDPAEPIADTRFIGAMLTPPYWLDPEFFQLATKEGETISFYMLMPLYKEEMDLKLDKGADHLEDLLQKANVDFVLDVGRPNVAVRKGWFKW